ncbi:MAG: PrsW family intramembrane metalloprotease [Verrucomicrobia bacterium]|nr:PrsW family intramembrane metalloprotease [Cytophagales bacterium]
MLLLALSVAPCLAIAFYIYERDKLDKEPRHLLVMCFILGIVSVSPALDIEEIAAKILEKIHVLPGSNWGYTFYYACMIATAEELCKFGFVMWFAYPRKEFDEPFDGITYGVMIGMGFATLENVLYVFQEKAFDEGVKVALMRMFTAVPAHATFAVLMGYFVGLAKFRRTHTRRLVFVGLMAAIIFHTAYDFFLFLKNQSFLVLGAFVSLVVAVFLSLHAMRLHQKNSPFAKSTSPTFESKLPEEL